MPKRNCYAPSKTGKFCWMDETPASKCKPGSFRSVHPGGRADIVITSCRLKKPIGDRKTAVVKKGKMKLKSGRCKPPACKRGAVWKPKKRKHKKRKSKRR